MKAISENLLYVSARKKGWLSIVGIAISEQSKWTTKVRGLGVKLHFPAFSVYTAVLNMRTTG
jgi:hypothetical protein